MKKVILAAACMMLAAESRADLLINPSNIANGSKTNIEGVVVSSEIGYETDNYEFDIERSILGGNLGFGIGQNFDIIGQFGLIADTEVQGIDADGDGFLIGGGARFGLTQAGKLSLSGHAVFSYQQEKIKDGARKDELKTKELHTGLTAAFQASKVVEPYGGLNIVIFDDGEWKTSSPYATNERDLERSDMFSLKLGVNIAISSVVIRPEVTIFGEQTLSIGVGSAI